MSLLDLLAPSANETIAELARRNRPRPTHDGWGNPIVYGDERAPERRGRPIDATVIEWADGSESTIFHAPGESHEAERRVAEHRRAIARRAATNGGLERMSFRATPVID
jgi:hypothetical protein